MHMVYISVYYEGIEDLFLKMLFALLYVVLPKNCEKISNYSTKGKF